ncbi:MAG: cytochrome c oxidase subunit II [Gammaproteobacteria bacterium]
MKLHRALSYTVLLLTSGAFATPESSYNMPRGVTPVSNDIHWLHMTIFWICVAIGVVVFGVMIYSLIMHRKSRGFKADKFHEHTALEIVWAVVPFLILVGMAIPATKVLIRMDDTSQSDLTIKITGYQWKWQYTYLDQGIDFFSNLSTPVDQIHNKVAKNPNYLLEVDNPMVVPINKKIRLLVTANDVIHSWWVPELGVKRDGIPGFINESWAKITKPGIYRGQCTELCGVNHAYMPVVVKAVTEPEFEEWLASQRRKTAEAEAASGKTYTYDEMYAAGEKIYNNKCSACHQINGAGLAPVFPALKGSSAATGPADVTIRKLLYGVDGSAMQAFENQLTSYEIAAVVTYVRNAWGNNTGDTIQPAEVIKVQAQGKPK